MTPTTETEPNKNIHVPQAGIDKFEVSVVDSKIAEYNQKPNQEEGGAGFEEAITATGYGKFNFGLIICVIPGYMCSVSVTSAVTFIFTKAKCDLNLSLVDMGTISGITYADRQEFKWLREETWFNLNEVIMLEICFGNIQPSQRLPDVIGVFDPAAVSSGFSNGMISSAMFWGFLSDTLGRKKVIVWGFLITGILDFLSGFSQNFTMLLITKYLGGFFFNGPFATMISYLAEMHRAELRAKIMLYLATTYTIATVVLSMLAWLILPYNWNFLLFPGMVIKSWNIYLMIISFIPISAGLLFLCVPESPKFLMSRGRDNEAMDIFRYVYAKNSGKTADDFPVKYLHSEKSEESARGFAALVGGFRQFGPLFRRPYLFYIILLCYMNMSTMNGHNTLRLWFPQLAAMLEVGEGKGLCSAIATNQTRGDDPENCHVIEASGQTYMQNAAIGALSAITNLLGGLIINSAGKRAVIITTLALCAVCSASLPFFGSGAVAEMTAVVLVALIISVTSLTHTALTSVVVDLFPTSLRVMAMATFLMLGRVGSISGNITFPILLTFGCIAPFMTIAAIFLGGGLSCTLLPSTKIKKLS